MVCCGGRAVAICAVGLNVVAGARVWPGGGRCAVGMCVGTCAVSTMVASAAVSSCGPRVGPGGWDGGCADTGGTPGRATFGGIVIPGRPRGGICAWPSSTARSCSPLCGRWFGRTESIQDDGLEEARRDAGHDPVLDRFGVVLDRARRRRRRRRAEQQVVDHRAERVEVGPRPLAQLRHLGVLLDRRVARLEDRGERLGAVADDAARRAEVEQHRRAVGRQQDVVGRDVAVVDALAVQQLERRRGSASTTLRIQASSGGCAIAPARVAQRDALQVRHHHVGGGVVFPEAVDLDQRRMVEAGQQPRLVDERAQADRVGLGERRSSAP